MQLRDNGRLASSEVLNGNSRSANKSRVPPLKFVRRARGYGQCRYVGTDPARLLLVTPTQCSFQDGNCLIAVCMRMARQRKGREGSVKW
jgi:hypothetical protein